MTITDKILPNICERLRQAIAEANGNEIFAAGRVDENGAVNQIEVIARGHESAVPAIMSRADGFSVVIRNHPSGRLTPTGADLSAAAAAAEDGFGFYIIDNDALSIYAVAEPVPQKERVLLEKNAVASLLGETGPLAAEYESYEERPQQIELTARITQCFNEDLTGVFEAGTGVGKSFAYLLPSILWAAENKERIVISTGTIALQHQLMEKDIPAAQKITGKNVLAVVVKGRQNYVCKRRLDDAARETALFTDEIEELQKIAQWAASSPSGCKSDLPFNPQESVWSRVCSESDGCLGIRCNFRESCFALQTRKKAAGANILIINHHLFFADIEARLNGAGFNASAVLPPYKRAVFDEAHDMENAATSFFSESFTQFSIQKQLSVLYRSKGRKILGTVLYFETLSDNASFRGGVSKLSAKIKRALKELESEAKDFIEPEGAKRLCLANKKDNYAALTTKISELRASLASITRTFKDVIETLDDEQKEQSFVWETKIALRRLENAAALCSNFLEWEKLAGSVFWIEKRSSARGGTYYRFTMTPLSVAPMIKEGVFDAIKTVVCLSATLRTGGSFNYWLRRVGAHMIAPGKIVCEAFSSPFDYKKRALLAVPADAPAPDSPDYQSYVENAVPRLVLTSSGRALVLFTSYELLRKSYAAAKDQLTSMGVALLKQGDDDRTRLLERFKNDLSSVLFATDSFWQGVDIPGESLTHVIIVKLPFRVPNDPICEARAEAISQSGGSAFMELSLPEAIMRFKQGFGRLIRGKTDYGAVTVLDNRLLTRRYGELFLKSLPETKTCFSSFSATLEAIENFLCAQNNARK